MVPDPPGAGMGGPSNTEPLIFVSDASAEAERLTAALRGRGYVVIDVPLSLVVSRAAVQRPALILCDVDADHAIDTMARLRDVPGGSGMDIIFLGEAGGTLDDMPDAVFHEGSGFFVRPVDVYALLHKVGALVGPPTGAAPSLLPGSARSAALLPSQTPYGPSSSACPGRPTEPPLRSSRPVPGNAPAPADHTGPITYEPTGPISNGPPLAPAWSGKASPSLPSSPADSSGESVGPSLPSPVPLGFGADAEPAGSPLARQIPQSEMSPELERLLARAEQRISRDPVSSSPPNRLSPDDEVEAVLPADVLAALDEPLDYDGQEDAGDSSPSGTRSGSEGGGTGLGTEAGTAAAARNPPGAFVTRDGVPGPPPSEAAGSGNTLAGSRTSIGGSLFPASQSHPGATSDAPAPIGNDEVTPPAVPSRAAAPGWSPAGPGSAGAAIESQTGSRSVSPASDRAGARPQHAAPTSQQAPPPAPPALAPRFEPPAAPPLAAAGAAVPAIPTVLGVGDAVRAIARAVRSRYGGALAVEDSAGIRRVVLRDGDLVTAASGMDGESLVAFLAQRGVLAPDVAARLGRKLAQFGRFAGAALIAHGHLRQDDLWPVLRAHAEWIVGRVLDVERGVLSLEKEIPGRLQAEPAVFGGATGAEVLVEVVRRSVPPGEAIRRMGGPSARFADGPAASLLGECALGEADTALVHRAPGCSIAELLESTHPDDPAPMLYALVELGVLEILSANAPAQHDDAEPPPPQADEIDEEALRARIETRMALVREGDYFAVLGVRRGATGYDIRRAYLELRRSFEPSRILSAHTADLRDDVDVIREVLDEAYEILRDPLRRDRYHRALEATPR